MKNILHLVLASLMIAGCLLQAQLWAGDKKEPEKKSDPPKEVVVKDQLMNSDLKDKVRTGSYCKTYTYKMIEGRNYQLDMRSTELDSYLRLENPDGVQVAYDDDGGGFPNARIIYRAPKTGDYTIICTTFGQGSTGKYILTVKDLTGGPLPKEEKKDKIGQGPRLGDAGMPLSSCHSSTESLLGRERIPAFRIRCIPGVCVCG